MATIEQLIDEDLIGLAEAGRIAKVGPRVITRWGRTGFLRNGERVRLELVKLGGKYRTTKNAIVRFIAALNGEDEPAPMPRTATQRRKASEAAEKELIAMGL